MKLNLKLQPSKSNGFRKYDIVPFDRKIFSEAYFHASEVTDHGDHNKKFPQQAANTAARMNDSQTSALEPFEQPASPLPTMISNQVKTTASLPATITPVKDHGITCDSSHISSTSFLVSPSEIQHLPQITTNRKQASE